MKLGQGIKTGHDACMSPFPEWQPDPIPMPRKRIHKGDDAVSAGLWLRITYLGKELNRHGGDWEELHREGMPTRLLANGHLVHDFIEAPELTQSHDFDVPPAALDGAPEELVLSIEPKWPDKVTFRNTSIPIAELWVCARA